MIIEAEERMVVCSNCSRPLGEFSTEIRYKLGPCCADLPEPWDDARSQTREDDEESPRPSCAACGSHRVRLLGERVESIELDGYTESESEDDDPTVWFYESDAVVVDMRSIENVRVMCRDCGEPYNGYWSWAS